MNTTPRAELAIPLMPPPPTTTRPAPDANLLNDPGHAWFVAITHLESLTLAWWTVTAACVAAFGGCVAATGAALVITHALTWHALVTTGIGLAWLGGAVLSAGHARSLGRLARDTSADVARAVL